MAGVEFSSLRKFVAPEFVFGVGARKLAPQYASHFGARRVMVVTDPGLNGAGWGAEVVGDLRAHGTEVVVFAEVTANPKDLDAERGAQLYLERGCAAIVAVGGGSCMDCAKGIGIVATNPGSLADYEGADRVENACPPLVCVPTTAGTASDVSPFVVISRSKSHHYMTIVSKALVPDVSLVDPETTTTMDEELSAHTGMVAFTHAAEAVASDAHSPITDLHALEAIALVDRHLSAALSHGNDLAARRGMMLGSLQAGLAFSNAGLGAAHALAHSVSGALGVAHGLCSAVLLPAVIEHNWAAAAGQYGKLAAAMGLAVGGLPEGERLEQILERVRDLQRRASSDLRLRDLGVSSDDLPQLAASAATDVCLVTNPADADTKNLEVVLGRAF
jgi:alcohol dehydrogenase class IV